MSFPLFRKLRGQRVALAALSLALGLGRPLDGAVPAFTDPLLEPPVVNTRPRPEHQDAARVAGMVIGMDRTPKGRIWGAWTGTGDNHESYFILATSDDSGVSWSRPRVVIDPAEIPGQPAR